MKRDMRKYILRKLVELIFTLLFVTLLSFLLMPSKNAARILKAFGNSNLCFLKNIRFPSLKKEEDIVISILIETNGLQRRLWELNTAKNI